MIGIYFKCWIEKRAIDRNTEFYLVGRWISALAGALWGARTKDSTKPFPDHLANSANMDVGVNNPMWGVETTGCL